MPKKTITASFEKITPAQAKVYLGNNPNYRKLSERRAKNLARIIKGGGWEENGQSIIFGQNGELIDGQHRLGACVVSGVAIWSVVVWGVKFSNEIDRNQPRRFSDSLYAKKYKNVTSLAAVINKQWRMENGILDDVSMCLKTPSITELWDAFERHPRLEHYTKKAKRSSAMIADSIMGFLYYQFSLINKDAADLFVDHLVSGENMKARDPIMKLRERLTKDKLTRNVSKKISTIEKMAIIIKAWNFWRQGTLIVLLAYRPVGPQPESFPEIK